MSLGGGNFLTQNKVIPGAYINFVSAAKASATLGDRGVAAIGIELDWGVDGEIFKVENGDFTSDSLKIFGYDYTHAKMKGLRDLFKNIKYGYFYKLTTGEKATNTYATAKYKGTRGNQLKIAISTNVDTPSKFDVKTLLDDVVKDIQIVTTSAELVANDWVTWKTFSIAATAGTVLTGGTSVVPTGTEHQTFLDKLEAYSFNTLGCLAVDSTTIGVYENWTKRMRDQIGAKFQLVAYRKASDYEGVIPVENTVLDSGEIASFLVYWTTGAEAGCPINESLTNRKYDGEATVDVNYKQSVLEANIKAGKFMFHKVNDEVRVLTDINSFVSFTSTKGEDFASNQTIRVLDQIANDIAVLFNTKYLGKVPNDAIGRTSFWNDVVKHHQELQTLRAIENFVAEDVGIDKGNDKKSVEVSDGVYVTNAMEKLYMTVKVQ